MGASRVLQHFLVVSRKMTGEDIGESVPIKLMMDFFICYYSIILSIFLVQYDGMPEVIVANSKCMIRERLVLWRNSPTVVVVLIPRLPLFWNQFDPWLPIPIALPLVATEH